MVRPDNSSYGFSVVNMIDDLQLFLELAIVMDVYRYHGGRFSSFGLFTPAAGPRSLEADTHLLHSHYITTNVFSTSNKRHLRLFSPKRTPSPESVTSRRFVGLRGRV